MRWSLGVLVLGLCLSAANAQSSAVSSAFAPAPAAFNLSQVLGNLTAREDACSQYSLPEPYNNVTYINSIINPYKSVVVGPVNYTYHRFGPLQTETSNSTLVLLPGSRQTSNVWTPDLLQYLAAEREVVTVDYPGAGSNSTEPSDQLTLDSIAQSLLGFFQALNLTQPDVLGLEWGGTIALQLGAYYGDSVGNLVLVGTTSGGSGYLPGEFIASNQTVNADDLNALSFPSSQFGENGLCKLNAFQALVPGPGNLTGSELANQTQVINNAWKNNTLSENLGNITNPTLLIAGQLDVIIDFQNTLFLNTQINSSVIFGSPLIAVTGQGILFQGTQEVGPFIASFLDAVSEEGDISSDESSIVVVEVDEG